MNRVLPARLAAAVLLVSVPLALACGDPPPLVQPSPEVVETAETIATPVTIDAPYSLTPVPDDEEVPEDILLDGRVFGSGSIGVVLAHMRPADQTSWFEFATRLSRTGEFTVLTFDFRGYGESTGIRQFDEIDTDLTAAYEYMRDVLQLERIYLVGASMGGTAAIVVAAHVPVDGVVAISTPAQFIYFDVLDYIDDVTMPKLFVTAEGDVPQFRSLEEMWEVAPEPKERVIYGGDAHGTELFDTEHGEDLEQRIREFLTR
jgi:uncharacterized protein